MLGSVLKGVVQGGQMITGEEPVTRLLPENVMAAASLGAGLPPASRFAPGMVAARPGPEGQNMMAAAQQARGMEFPRPVPMERISPEDAALAKEAVDAGVPLTGKPSPAQQVAKERAIVQLASRTFGEDAPALIDTVIQRAHDRIGKRMNQIEQSHTVDFDPQFRGEMQKIVDDTVKGLASKKEQALVENHVNEVMVDPQKTAAKQAAAKVAPKPKGGPKPEIKPVYRNRLTGDQYADLMHQGGSIEKFGDHDNPSLAKFGQRIEKSVRDVLVRNLPPDTAREYQMLRYQYKNLKTVEKAVESTGTLNHAKLDRAVSKAFPNRVKDKSPPLVKLSDIANKFGKAPAISRAGPVAQAAEMIAGYGIGHMLGGPIGGVGGMIAARAGDIATRNAIRELTRPRLTDKLIERALASLPPPGARRNAINAMMSRQGASTLTMMPPGGGNAMRSVGRP
jgi:hypothetical protein